VNGTTTSGHASVDTGKALLQLDNVTLRYAAPPRATTAIDRVSLSVARGERVVLLGPSGCGKSSLLRAVAGFIPPAGGAIRLDARPVRRPGPDRIMVFQEFDQLLPWRTAKGNVMLPLTASGRCDRRTAAVRAADWLDKVGLRAFADAFPHQLSGGMKQRVALARALALEPAILLMDEPFAALDALTRSAMEAELLRLWDELRFTMLFVTHSIEEAVAVGHRIAVLTPGPGRIREEFGVPSGPGSAERAALLDHINRLVLTAPTTSGGPA
jgi:NitT/TauT family transport system ATP-binding protein